MPTVLTIPRPPSVNSLWTNVRGRGRVRTRRYQTWLNAAGWEIKSQKPERVTGPYYIAIAIGRERNKDGSPSARRIDIGNFEKAISDLLVELGVIEDDSLAESITIYWSAAEETGRARIMIHGERQ